MLKYTIEVYTGSRPNASSGANVYMMLVGERGDSGRRQLLRSFSTEDEPFRKNQVNSLNTALFQSEIIILFIIIINQLS